MSQSEVDEIGQGRVWSGIDAIEIGLVDELGGLDKAINAAADMAELTDYKLKDLPKQEDPMQKLIQELSNQAYVKMFGNPMLGKAEKYYRSFQQVFEAEGIYTRLPVDIIID
jgi:protease-4